MNNGFPGSFTPVSNNMGLTCQPNFNGPQPGHCVLHHVDAAPVPNINRHISSAQSNAIDLARTPHRIQIDLSKCKNIITTVTESLGPLNISLDSLANNKNDLQKQLIQTQSLLKKLLVEKLAAEKEVATKIPIANEKEKYFIKSWAYNEVLKGISGKNPSLKQKIDNGDKFYGAIAQSGAQWKDWLDFRTKLINKENAITRLNSAISQLDKTQKHIDKITAEIHNIEVKKKEVDRLKKEKQEIIQRNTRIVEQKKAESNIRQDLPLPPPLDSDKISPGVALFGDIFLSNEQQAQKSKEMAECQTAMCKIGKEAQWAITDLAQGTSFAAGMVAGVPAGLYETVDGIVKTASNPAEAYCALKTLSDSGNVLGNLAQAVKQSWTDRIDRMEAEYQKGSISGAFNAGVEGGKLTTDIGGLVTGGAGFLKSGAVVAEKAIAKVTSKAGSVAKTGSDVALSPASTPERMARYMAPKGVPDTYKAAILANQQALKNALLMKMPPLENPSLGKALVDRLTLATPQQTKVAEQLLDIGIKASITGITAMTLKDVADRITFDELNHITTLSSAGNPAATGHYLSSLQDKYAPAHTGNQQLADTALRNTGSNPSLAPQAPGHTGNNQISGQGVTHTGNTAGVTDTGGYILSNPSFDPLSTKDIVYLSEKPSSKIDSIINETLSGKKNFTSSTILTSDEALAAGLKFLGTGYKEIGKSGSGVYHSADGTKEFRIDSGSISGAHLPGVPHVHFGMKNPETGKYISNNHVPYKD